MNSRPDTGNAFKRVIRTRLNGFPIPAIEFIRWRTCPIFPEGVYSVTTIDWEGAERGGVVR